MITSDNAIIDRLEAPPNAPPRPTPVVNLFATWAAPHLPHAAMPPAPTPTSSPPADAVIN